MVGSDCEGWLHSIFSVLDIFLCKCVESLINWDLSIIISEVCGGMLSLSPACAGHCAPVSVSRYLMSSSFDTLCPTHNLSTQWARLNEILNIHYVLSHASGMIFKNLEIQDTCILYSIADRHFSIIMADDTSALSWPAIIDTVIFTVLKVLLISIAADVIHCKITCENIPKMARSCLFAPDKSELTDKKLRNLLMEGWNT